VTGRPRSWALLLSEDAAHVLTAMRTTGHADLHDQVVLFLQALAIEAGAAADADKPLPGMAIDDRRYNVDVPFLPVLISYTRNRRSAESREGPEPRELIVTDLLWLG
jgi:hypothetical protein